MLLTWLGFFFYLFNFFTRPGNLGPHIYCWIVSSSNVLDVFQVSLVNTDTMEQNTRYNYFQQNRKYTFCFQNVLSIVFEFLWIKRLSHYCIFRIANGLVNGQTAFSQPVDGVPQTVHYPGNSIRLFYFLKILNSLWSNWITVNIYIKG